MSEQQQELQYWGQTTSNDCIEKMHDSTVTSGWCVLVAEGKDTPHTGIKTMILILKNFMPLQQLERR